MPGFSKEIAAFPKEMEVLKYIYINIIYNIHYIHNRFYNIYYL